MKYMLLIYLDEDGLSETDRAQCYGESAQFAVQLSKTGQYLGAGPLHPTSTATSVRVRDNKRLVTDGPFAETKELVAGYWLWQVRSMDEALEWLKRSPYEGGTFEIREVIEYEGM